MDDTTDVLSFPADEKDPETGKGYLGDIIISYPRATQQAAGAGHTTGDELSLLVIHGVLHLAGHDHAEVDEERIMFALQNDALNRLNLSIKGFNA
ncbi:MAG: rRNA maturation RNase YbeY [Anaerolineaceae bacterium]